MAADMVASFRYAFDPVGVIRKIGELLKPGGKAFICFGYEPRILHHSDLVQDNNTSFNSSQKRMGSKMLMIMWLHTIQGFNVLGNKVSIESKNYAEANPNNIIDSIKDDGMIILERTEEPVTKPAFFDFMPILKADSGKQRLS